MAEPVDLNKTYDAVVVGSGAAGGMAAHVLTSRGLKVLMLEAGKKLPIEEELRSMQWPYDNPHRGQLPPDRHANSFNEYTIRRPPYGPGFEKSKHLHSYIGSTDYVKNILVDDARIHSRVPTTRGFGRDAWAAKRTSGGAWRSGSPITISRPRAATVTAKIGPSAIAILPLITTRWICISASLA